jgi:hypothetical protein
MTADKMAYGQNASKEKLITKTLNSVSTAKRLG